MSPFFNPKRALMASAAVLGLALSVSANDKWENEDGDGNVLAAVSDDTINWGTTPPWRALEKINEHCSHVGCHTDDTLEVDTTIAIGPNDPKRDATIRMSIRAGFSQNDDFGTRENLVELAKAISAQGYDVEEKAYWGERSCEKSPNVGCLPSDEDPPTVDQYFQFKELHIRVDEGTGPDLFVKVEVKDGDGSGSGWCDNILSIGAALVGPVSGVAGSAFSLASLVCGEL